jgi:hypothetical protein
VVRQGRIVDRRFFGSAGTAYLESTAGAHAWSWRRDEFGAFVAVIGCPAVRRFAIGGAGASQPAPAQESSRTFRPLPKRPTTIRLRRTQTYPLLRGGARGDTSRAVRFRKDGAVDLDGRDGAAVELVVAAPGGGRRTGMMILYYSEVSLAGFALAPVPTASTELLPSNGVRPLGAYWGSALARGEFDGDGRVGARDRRAEREVGLAAAGLVYVVPEPDARVTPRSSALSVDKRGLS